MARGDDSGWASDPLPRPIDDRQAKFRLGDDGDWILMDARQAKFHGDWISMSRSGPSGQRTGLRRRLDFRAASADSRPSR